MKHKIYVLIFDKFSDWEAPYALWAISGSGRFEVVTVGFSKEPVKSIGGLTVLPDIRIDDVKIEDAAMLIVPGGDLWEQEFSEVTGLLQKLNEAEVPVAAICGGTLAAIRAGIANGKTHTSNDLSYVKEFVPDYRDESFYAQQPAVTGGNIITANGLSPVEFGLEIIKTLKLYDEADTEKWFQMCKHGIY